MGEPGVGRQRGAGAESEDQAVARLFATNFFGPVAVIKAALPGMRRGRSADRSSIRIDAYDQVLGRTGDVALGPQRGAPGKAAIAIMRAADDAEPPKLLVLGSDAVVGFRKAADDDARDIDRFEQLSRSTDATS